MGERQQVLFRDVLSKSGGDVVRLAARVGDASGVIDRECDLLRAEHTRIAAGASSVGDMSDEMAGLVHVTAIIVAAETGPLGGLVVEAVAGLLD